MISPDGRAALDDAVRLVGQHDLVAQDLPDLRRDLATGLAATHGHKALDDALEILYDRTGLSLHARDTEEQFVVARSLIYWARSGIDATPEQALLSAAVSATMAGIKSLHLRNDPDAAGVRTWREELIGGLAVMSVSTLQRAKTMVPQPIVNIPERFATADVTVAAIAAIDEALGIATQLD